MRLAVNGTATQYVNNPVTLGQALMAASLPVTLASDQTLSVLAAISGAVNLAQQVPVVSPAVNGNSSTTPLADGATFTGTGESALGYEAGTVLCLTDHAGILYVDQSQDGANWDLVDSWPVVSGILLPVSVRFFGSYYRVRLANGAGAAQTYLRLQTIKYPIRSGSGRPPLATVATGALAIALSTALTGQFRLREVTVHLNAVPTTSGDLTITLDAIDGAPYDTVLARRNMAAGQVVDYVYIPEGEGIVGVAGDQIAVAYANADLATYGVRIVTEAI